jgi:hypothetical protein
VGLRPNRRLHSHQRRLHNVIFKTRAQVSAELIDQRENVST